MCRRADSVGAAQVARVEGRKDRERIARGSREDCERIARVARVVEHKSVGHGERLKRHRMAGLTRSVFMRRGDWRQPSECTSGVH